MLTTSAFAEGEGRTRGLAVRSVIVAPQTKCRMRLSACSATILRSDAAEKTCGSFSRATRKQLSGLFWPDKICRRYCAILHRAGCRMEWKDSHVPLSNFFKA